MNRRYFLLMTILISPFFLISCDELLTGQVVGPEDPYVHEFFMRCSERAGLNVEDLCIDNNGRVLKILASNSRQGRIESFILDFVHEDSSQRREIALTMDVGRRRVLEQRVPDSMERFDQVSMQPTYRAHDGSMLGCDSFDVQYEEIRECQNE